MDWNQVEQDKFNYQDYQYPEVSVVIPCFNHCAKIALTLDSILGQNYFKYEVLVIDAGSTDRTLEVVKSYRDERIRIYSVSGYKRYEMLNKGISQASGSYVNCLFPGDFYIYPDALLFIMETALDRNLPDLVYCGTLLRDGRSDPKILYREMTLNLLKRGQQPTSLQSCWFKTETIRSLGKFNTNYKLRGGYELICRFMAHPGLRAVSTKRVLTDYDLRHVTRAMVFSHFIETLKIVRQYFGLKAMIRWLFIQKDFKRLLKIWWRQVKMAFIGAHQ
ncbi:putative glycosyltransferase [Waddlia chondrophila 2032/99]|nr:glycosyltransferase [Waddlia chondrophila]CCB91661.1 putative glycosyltransferase [Waddlia chondrophila 2032/99]